MRKIDFRKMFKTNQKVRVGEKRKTGVIKTITRNFIVVDFGNYSESFSYSQLLKKEKRDKKVNV